MSDQKTYRIFVPEDDLDKFKNQEGKVSKETVIDESTREQFEAEIMVSQSPVQEYEKLLIQGRGGLIPGEWFVKIVKRLDEEEEEEVTVFESMRLGQRRGYMLRSMMAESEKGDSKKETMTSELQKRLKRKQELVEELLKKKGD